MGIVIIYQIRVRGFSCVLSSNSIFFSFFVFYSLPRPPSTSRFLLLPAVNWNFLWQLVSCKPVILRELLVSRKPVILRELLVSRVKDVYSYDAVIRDSNPGPVFYFISVFLASLPSMCLQPGGRRYAVHGTHSGKSG